jgi:hypothetical protein
MRRLLVMAVLAAGTARADDAVVVYVNEVLAGDAAQATGAASITSALCSEFAKDKRVSVICATDVKQLLDFAASSELLGGSAPGVEPLLKRIDAARFVVEAKLAAGKGTTVLTASIGPKDADAQVGAMHASAPLLSLDESSGPRSGPLLDRMPQLARRLVDVALAPKSLEPSSRPPVAPPPAPLAPLAPATEPGAAHTPTNAKTKP